MLYIINLIILDTLLMKINLIKCFEVNPDDLIVSCSATVSKIAIVHDNAKKYNRSIIIKNYYN